MRFRLPSNQLARWLEVLSHFVLTLIHRKGKGHENADFWSRVGCNPRECDCYDRNSILEELPCSGCKTCRKHEQWSVLPNVDDVVPLFARNVSCHILPGSKQRKFSCMGMAMALLCLLFGVLWSVLGRVLEGMKLSGRCFNAVVLDISEILKMHRSKLLRRLRTRTDRDSLGGPPVERLSDDNDILFPGEKSSRNSSKSPIDDDLLQNDGSLKELKR